MRVRYRSAKRTASRYLIDDPAPSGIYGAARSGTWIADPGLRNLRGSFPGNGKFPLDPQASSDWSEGPVFVPTVKPWRPSSGFGDDVSLLASQTTPRCSPALQVRLGDASVPFPGMAGLHIRLSAPNDAPAGPIPGAATVVPAGASLPASTIGDAPGGGLGVETPVVPPATSPTPPVGVGEQTGIVRLAGSPRADRIAGGAGSDEIDGREGNDELLGGEGGDALVAGEGDDVLDGGPGADVARFSGSVFEYDISRQSATQFTVRHARAVGGASDGTDLVRNVERLDFRDRKILLDGSNNAPLVRADDGLTTVDGRSLTIPFSRLLGNDFDFDGDRLTITQVKGKPADSVRIVGNSIVFTPPAGVQWALASFTSYETPFLYTVSDGRGGTATTSATVTITRPADLRGLPAGPAGTSLEGAGGPGEAPGATFTKVSGQSVTGTDGDDLILVPTSGAMTGGIVDGQAGVDELRFTSVGNAQTLTLPSSLANVERIVIGTGTAPAADTTGTSAHVVTGSAVGYGLEFVGNAGANRITGTNFADRIDGGVGDDRMTGGTGDDTYFVDSAADVVNESSGTGGTDTVYASVSYTLPSRVENLSLLGTQNINATGNSLANTLVGNAGGNALSGAGGADTLDGGAGADTMAGGGGNDTYLVDDPGDVVTEASGAGTDTVRANVTYTLAANVENLVLVGTGAIDGTGNTLGNTIDGSAGNNTLRGGAGVDALNGGDGDDVIEGGAGNDTLDGGAGTNIARYSGAQADYTVAAGTGGAFTITDRRSGAPDGVDTVRNISLLQFSDVAVPLGGPANQSPVAVADSGTTAEDTTWTVPTTVLTANDSDPDAGDILSITGVGGASNGTVALAGGNVSFTPAINFNGTGSFTYTLSDGHGGTATGSVSVAVTAVNDAPVAGDDDFATPADTPLTIAASALLANDSDVEGAPITVVNVGGATNGTVSASGGDFVFTPAAGFGGTASFTYQASDGQAQSAPATVRIAVGSPAPNEIVLENQKPGSPQSEWDVSDYDSSIEGYAAQFSSNLGETVQFKVDTDATDYRIDIYRLGYYGGNGARKVATIDPTWIGRQPTPVSDDTTGLVDAGNWNVSASWTIPTEAVSGVYIAKLVRESGPAGANHIPFVVRDDSGRSDILFQTSDTTWQAYNDWGGNSLYSGSPVGRAYKVSYNRPINTRYGSAPGAPEDFLFDSEYPTIRFLEANGYDVSYFSGIDSDRRGAELLEHQVFLSVGHDEYWSGQQRANVEAARDAGVDLGFLSGNEVFWKTRWESSIDGSGTPYTTLVSYKETHPDGVDDPSSQATGTWRDPRFESDAGRPENALTGQLFMVNDGSDPPTKITVPVEEGQLRFWRNTGLGTSATTLASDIISYEWDEDLDNGFRPAGLIRLSSTVDPSVSYLQDFGSTYGSGSATHSLTLYRASSGALVFGAGTTQWGWGLDAVHDGSSPTDSRIQQATVNLLADMGAQPTTLAPALLPATASTDTTAPTSVITSPSGGTNLQPGTAVTITGTAADVGGRVGGVEVSTDGGSTWRRASGRSNWTYDWTPQVAGNFTIRSRAADDTLNLETPGTGVNVTVGGATSETYSLWPASTTPAVVSDGDSVPVELGVKLVPDADGQITGIRFYKGPQNLGTHVGNLWTSTGTLLASTTFTDESAGGWQQASFANPVPVTAGTTYVASYFAPQGRYSVNDNYFTSSYTNGPLTAPSSASAEGNGVYRYGAASAFPNATFSASNYWVDVVFNAGPINQLPIANPDSFSFAEDAVLTLLPGQLTSNDTDPENDPLTVTAVGSATNGTVRMDSGSIVFTPSTNFNGSAGFAYTLSDGRGSATGSVGLAVTPVNDAPVANADAGFSTPFETALSLPVATLLGNDTDVDGDVLSIDSVGTAVNGAVALDAAGGLVVFTPAAGYAGPASFAYTIRDPASAPATAVVSLVVGAAGNQAPNAVADIATTDEDHPVTINVLANDSDPEGNPLAVALLDLTGTQGTVRINTDNTISYDPAGAFQSLEPGQQASDTFSYRLSDGQGATATASVSVTVTGVAEAAPNPIVAENQRPGTPQSVWGINGPTTDIEGFATDISVDQGQRVDFKVNTVASDYRIDIYRLGYYQGNGARYVTTVQPTSITRQPTPVSGADGLVDAGNWSVSASWNVPTDAVSGVYVAHLVREDGTLGENHMYFVVRDDDGRSDMLFQTSDTTWQAYNLWGGGDFYTGTPSSPTQAHKVSYNRPFGPATNSANVPLFDAEYPMIRWLEANGYNVSYSTGIDTDRRGQELLEHRAFLSVGHDEYWSGLQRTNIEAARDAGVNLAFFSGNEVYWKTRWEDNNRTLVSYKETWANSKIDPSPEWTGTWRDPRFSPPSDGGRPENGLTGTLFQVDSYRLDTIDVPAEDGWMRFWRNTSLANLSAGQTASLTPNVLGYEWDEAPDNGFRPAGSIRLSSTSLGVSQYLLDYGSTTGPAEATHNLSLYRAPSGAMVFGAGTTRWSWGLDSDHVNETSVVDPRMQQATVNLFADMGIQPDSLASGLVPATASSDRTAPASSIQTPAAGTTIAAGQATTITGMASDVGGRVGGVELSFDNGTTWRSASGRENWTYSWRPTTTGSVTIAARAIDDSLNVQPTPTTLAVDVQASGGPWSLFAPTSVPSQLNVNDPNPVELGVKFRSDIAATITGVRFYKGSQDVGPHVANLWTATGTRLATANFASETASGWQQVDFASPIPIEADQLYVASYHTGSGFYSADTDFFSSQGIDVGPLHAPASPLVAGGNGVYQYGASALPTNTWNGSNYWVDVVLASA
ncbi:MAG: DUF4082 domain-containing protein [Burkholderiaceae bacterium]|nr:DUF4082 domain-containing protein [Burkholderiaceae bacterium]